SNSSSATRKVTIRFLGLRMAMRDSSEFVSLYAACTPRRFYMALLRITLSVNEGTGSGETVPSLTLRVIHRRGMRLMDIICGAGFSLRGTSVPLDRQAG